MKHRLLVMNGRRILESESGGEWKTQKVSPAGTLKPGIYNLYTAAAAADKKPYTGPVIHADKDSVVQQAREGLIQFPRSAFDSSPEIGVPKTIELNGPKATVSAAVAQTQKLRR